MELMKYMKWHVIALVGVPIIFVAIAFIRNKTVGPEGAAMENIEKRLRVKMKDPESMGI